MIDRRLSDARISAALRTHLPASAPAGLQDRIRIEVAQVRQLRPLPSLVAGLGDADPTARRTALLVAAALLLALALAAALAVGASRLLRPDPLRDLSLDPPKDVPAFVLSVHDRLPELGSVAITTVQDGTKPGAIYVASNGDIRVERYRTAAATEPEWVRVISGTATWELVSMPSGPAWVNTGGIAEDPRVFILATLGPSPLDQGCEMTRDGVSGTPAIGWTYVGLETVAGRRVHRFQCHGENIWIDVETRLPMRVQAPDGSHGIEVTEVAFGPQPATLFSPDPPPGVPVIPQGVYSCSIDPSCLASPRPVVTPPPASDQPSGPVELAPVISHALAAYADPPAFDVVIAQSNTKRSEAARSRVVFDGTSRWRTEEIAVVGDGRLATIKLFGPRYLFVRETHDDGSTVWIDRSFRPDAPRGFPLWSPGATCAGGWRHRGVDLVADRKADHIACPQADDWTDFWIDRESGLALRIVGREDPVSGADVAEVVELRLGPSPASMFELPPDAVVVQAGAQSQTPGPLSTSGP